uniref:Uncharacterized protein n=1 Tax=Eutreptiella gymnastica TaxID=73025 RepID=A0A7S4LD60_9EUGL
MQLVSTTGSNRSPCLVSAPAVQPQVHNPAEDCNLQHKVAHLAELPDGGRALQQRWDVPCKVEHPVHRHALCRALHHPRPLSPSSPSTGTRAHFPLSMTFPSLRARYALTLDRECNEGCGKAGAAGAQWQAHT